MKIYRQLQSSLLIFSVLLFINACSNSGNKKIAVEKINSLVSAQWLIEHINDDDLIVLDTTVIVNMDDKGGFSNVSGRDEYNAGHIPTAGFADLKGNLSSTDGSFDFVMPTPEEFALAMSELGVGNTSRVVLYSAQNQVWAARLWWMFRWAGFDQVALLDGGLKAWTSAGGDLSTDAAIHTKKPFTLALRPEVIADHDEVFAAMKNEQVNIIDALPDAHYMGTFSLYKRPGHIPGASNIPSSDLLDESGLYKPLDELEMMFEINQHTNRVITYCGGGVAASAVAFTLYRLGYTDVSVYMGSLQEWIIDPENPMVVNNHK
ncbi:MAG: sulfurtransferase [Alcanivoracaceae bacterium]|nr:sulfurtransferase [Alcanivoracaceae bacterium]